jgi:hypothetical protein
MRVEVGDFINGFRDGGFGWFWFWLAVSRQVAR